MYEVVLECVGLSYSPCSCSVWNLESTQSYSAYLGGSSFSHTFDLCMLRWYNCQTWCPTIKIRTTGHADFPSDDNLMNLELCVSDRGWNMRVARPLCLHEIEAIGYGSRANTHWKGILGVICILIRRYQDADNGACGLSDHACE